MTPALPKVRPIPVPPASISDQTAGPIARLAFATDFRSARGTCGPWPRRHRTPVDFTPTKGLS